MSVPDYPLEATVDFKFTTRAFATGIPTTLAGTPAIEIYEDNSDTQITGAETLTVDFDSVTGLNNLRVVMTAANGFESGKSYQAVISTGTVGGVSVIGEVAQQFSVERSPALMPTTPGRTLDVEAGGGAGVDLGNVTGTLTQANVAWVDANSRVDLGSWLGTAVTISSTSAKPEVDVFSLSDDATAANNAEIDYDGTGYDKANSTIGTVTAATVVAATAAYFQDWFTVDSTQVSGDEVSGSAMLEQGRIVWDRLLTGATRNIATSAGRRLRNIQDFGIYDLASVWVDEIGGTSSGTIDGEDGTVANRSDDFDNGQTIAASVGLDNIHVQNGNTITLAATLNGFNVWSGAPNVRTVTWNLALGSQDISNSMFSAAVVTGIGTGTNPTFNGCQIGTVTLPPTLIANSSLRATLTCGSAGAYRFVDCSSGVAGASAPTVDLGAAVGASTMEFRKWSGGLNLLNVNTGDVVSVDALTGGTLTATLGGGTLEVRGSGMKALVINGTSGSVNVAGFYGLITDNSSGAVTITQTWATNQELLADAVWDEILTGATHNITNSSGRRLRSLQEFQGYDGGYVWIDTVSGVAGTEAFENGTVNNPVDSLVDALTIAASINSKKLFFLPGSSETLAEDMVSFLLHGQGWSLACGGFDLSNSYLQGAFVSGASTSDTQNSNFKDCLMFMASVGSAVLTDCAIHTVLTATEAGNLTLNNCYDAGGGGVPYIDFSVTGITVQLDRWAGDLEVRSMQATDSVKVVGNGVFIVHSGCTGGTAFLAGDFKVTDNASEAVAITFDDNTTNIAATKTDTGNLITRIPAALFSGMTSLAQWLGIIAGKQVGNATALTEIKATGAGSGTFSELTDSQEAQRDEMVSEHAALPTAVENRQEMDSNSTQLAAIVEDTAEIGAAGIGLSGIPWNASWDAEVESKVNDALVAIHLDHLLAVNYDPASKPGVATALLNELIVDDGTGVSQYSISALENGPSGSGSSPAVIADAVWDELQAGHVIAGSFGLFLDSKVSSAGGTIVPIQMTVSGRFGSALITLIQGESPNVVIVFTDENNDPVDITGVDLALAVFDLEGTATEVWRWTSADGELTAGGASNNELTLTGDGTNTTIADRWDYTLWDLTNDAPLGIGVLRIRRSSGPAAPA